MTRIAIVGAGFAGLGLCWHLLQKKENKVTLFDAKGVGGGASSIATGLLHAYPGEQGRLSLHGYEAMSAAHRLLKVAEQALGRPVADYAGFMRLMGNVEDAGRFSEYPDVEKMQSGAFWVRSGVTVFPELYLNGLMQACSTLGAELQISRISSLDELKEYDLIILTTGAGIVHFTEASHLKLKLIKGQVLTYAHPAQSSILGKGHVTKGESPGLFYLGSTYERTFHDDAPDLQTALDQLQPKLNLLLPEAINAPVIDCRAGVRVAFSGHYMPRIEKLTDKCWAVTGLGSRGLLYHAYLAEQFVQLSNI